jgi:hypothetical protein
MIGDLVAGKAKLFNQTSFTPEDVATMSLLVKIRNLWRQRVVYVYQHPTDPESVVSHGIAFDETWENYCVEPKSAFAFELSQGKLFVETK